MDIIRLNSKDIKKLNKYELHSHIENTESILYLYNHKKELLKLFKSNDKDYILNKSFIINKLFYIKDNVDMKELVMPNSLVKVSGLSIGYTMDFISQNTNLSLILNSEKVSIEDKIYFLKKIGKIIEKIELNDTLNKNGFHLGDIHDGNFIYDNKNNMIKGVDLDSAYVRGVVAPSSKYLTFNDKLWDFPKKYPLDENDRHIPNHNTTIISYIYMLLNFISGEYTPNISISRFCNILNDLSSVGFNKELLDAIYNIYLPKDNYLDFELIDTITPELVLKYKNKSL